MNEITLRVPLPPSRNRGRQTHWAVAEKQKKRYWESCDAATLLTRFPAAPFQRVEARVIAFVRNINDEDNMMARMKFLQDWCKSRGIVKDDTPACWSYVAKPEQIIERKKAAYLILTLRAVPPAE